MHGPRLLAKIWIPGYTARGRFPQDLDDVDIWHESQWDCSRRRLRIRLPREAPRRIVRNPSGGPVPPSLSLIDENLYEVIYLLDRWIYNVSISRSDLSI